MFVYLMKFIVLESIVQHSTWTCILLYYQVKWHNASWCHDLSFPLGLPCVRSIQPLLSSAQDINVISNMLEQCEILEQHISREWITLQECINYNLLDSHNGLMIESGVTFIFKLGHSQLIWPHTSYPQILSNG